MKIVFNNVYLNFMGKNIFSSLNYEFTPNGITLIKGANGSGKSTLLKLAAHILSPTSGKISMVDGENTLKGREYQKNMVMITPEMKLYENLTAEENLKFFAGLRGVNLKDEEILALWERMGLNYEEIQNKHAQNLSTGMNQRVKFAVFIAVNAPVWLLDEPTSNLDDAGREVIIREVKKAKKEGKTVLWASNDEREFSVADAIIDLSKTEA